jgi:uncharacterized membrane protein required for colicin V production
MKFNFVDILTLAFVGVVALRGWKRGLPREFPPLISAAVVFVVGAGLYRLTVGVLSEASRAIAQLTGGIGFLGVLVLAFFLLRHFKRRMREWAEKQYSEKQTQKRWGAIAGAVRALLWASIAILFLSHLMHTTFAENSLFGWCLNRFILPVYKITHG